MLLPWRATTVLGHLIGQCRTAGAGQVAVVCADGDPAISAELDRLGIAREQRITNSNPARGMFSSVQCAAAWRGWAPDLQHLAIVLGDQPHLSIETLRAVSEFAARHPQRICQPTHGGRRRHPVFLPSDLLPALAGSNAGTLKEFLAPHAAEVSLIEVADPGLDFDIDTPADYEIALRRFANSVV